MTEAVKQLHAAWLKTGWSAVELLRRTKLDCDRTSMGRKIRGQQSVSASELDAIASALGYELIARPRRRRAA